MQHAEVNGARLAYAVSGNGDPVVLIHGFSLDMRMWDPQIPALEDRFRVVRYDLRGFGRSAVPDGSPYVASEDLAALLDYLQIERAALVGFSFGGTVAVHFALDFPDRVTSLILIDSVVGGWPWSEEGTTVDRAVWQAGKEQGTDAARRIWLEHPMFTRVRAIQGTAADFDRMVEAYSGFHWTTDDSQVWPDPPALERLGEIGAPTVVAVGELDTPDLQGMAEALANGIPGAQKTVVRGAGHMSNMEKPDQVTELIIGHLTAG